MLLVDTNVLASLLTEGPFTVPARDLHIADVDWHSERFVLIELCNVFATQVRTGRMTVDGALAGLRTGTDIIEPGLMEANHADVLMVASQLGISAYDARFIAAAHALMHPLVTKDRRLREKVPIHTCSIAQALANR